MLIDWFTVGAQALNFLILVWVLKHFLYKPILNAIDAREKRIAAELADADAKKSEAQKERDDFRARTRPSMNSAALCLSKATDEAKTEHERLLDEARKEADSLRASQATRVEKRSSEAGQGDHASGRATKSLPSRARRLRISPPSVSKSAWERCSRAACAKWTAKAKETLGAALKTSTDPAVVRSAFEMPAEQRATIQNALNETFSAEIRVRFETAPDAICGIELTANGQKIGWSIAEYLTSLDQKVGALLDARCAEARPAAEAEHAGAESAAHAGQMSASPDILQDALDRAFGGLRQAREAFTPQLTPHEVGIVTNVSTGIATVSGLPGVGFEELVRFPGRSTGHRVQRR